MIRPTNLLIIYDNPPSYCGRSFWSSLKEFEDNRLWLTQEVHRIISFPVIREKVTSVSELFVYAFKDIQVFSYPVSYFVSDHPAYVKQSLYGLIGRIYPDIIIFAGRKAVHTLVERYRKKFFRTVQVVWMPSPFQCSTLHQYERDDILRRVEDALRLCTNACYTGST